MTTDVSMNGNAEDHADDSKLKKIGPSENDIAQHHSIGKADKEKDRSQSLINDDIQNDVNIHEDDIKSCEKSDDRSIQNDRNTTGGVKTSSEDIEVDRNNDDDNCSVEVISNAISPSLDVLEIDSNNQGNPNLISEENSRDSLVSNTSIKSKECGESNVKDGLVSTVKVDDDEILITLNEDEEGGNKEDEPEFELKEINGDNNVSVRDDQEKKTEVKESSNKESSKVEFQFAAVTTASVTTAAKAAPLLTQSTVNSILIPSSGVTIPLLSSQNVLIPGAPSGIQIVRQGNQFGYITLSGSQRVFVPVSGVQVQGPNNSVLASHLATGVYQQSSTKPQTQTVTLEELRPKSSMETIELMKWEVQNRIADNYNWSVAFHSRKEELSTITTFLQELGSDVVKEQVYKDIIQIQTKKKENGDLKEPEIESLEKMKTVYENTKKKVEHLQLESKECEQCKFKTESTVVMKFHEDFPHYDPPWDISKGWMECSHCSFRTKVAAQFIFHMKDIHSVQAKFMEKGQPFQCSLCPLNASTKNKLEKHQQKCTKHFKLNSNLQPYYHDVNFCMKTCYYKPKKPVPSPKPVPKPTPTMNTRQQQGGNLSVQKQNINQPTLRPSNLAPRPRPPVLRTPVTSSQIQRPIINVPTRPRMQPPTLQRAPVPPQQQRPTRPQGKEMAGFEVCELCGGYVKDRQALRIHFYYAHKVEMPQAIFNRPNAPLTCEVCKEHFWTTQGLTKHKTARRHFAGVPPQNTPSKIVSEQECFMCLKKYPNLFVHFEKVHGMTMKDLILVRKCIMCGASTNDYKSLETHLVSAHGVMIRVNDYINDKNKPLKPATPIISGGKNVGKINYCVFCQIQFPDNIQLTMHCIQVHATCETCGMVVATSKHLNGHNCRKAHINKLCYICGTKVASQEKYAIHLRSHVTPCQVKLKNLNDDEIASIKEKIKREYKPAVISLDSDEDSDIEVVENKPSKNKDDLDKDVVTVDMSAENKDDKSEKKMEEHDGGLEEIPIEMKAKCKGETGINDENGKIETIEITEKVVNEENKLGNNESNKNEMTVKNSTGEKIDADVNDENEMTEIGEKIDSGSDIVMTECTEKCNEDEFKILEAENDLIVSEPNIKINIDGNELLESYEESNTSTGERKRKKSESDIDKDELPRESGEYNIKRKKTENDDSLNKESDEKMVCKNSTQAIKMEVDKK